MDGFEVCKRLNLKSETSEIPIIFLTAIDDKESIIRGFGLGAVDYIAKPFNEAELVARVRLHLKLKLNTTILEQKNEKLTASIKYAKIIQNAILPSSDALKYFLPEYFIIYKPRDIVSGDFYWVKQLKNRIFISVADCTGHGVPGAFISLLGMAYLNEIIYSYNLEEDIKANEILNELRTRVKKNLHQDEQEKSLKDGMDMALCIINLETKVMQYAGANRPLFLIRQNTQTQEYELLHYKADKFPIAFYRKEKLFTNTIINLQTNDQIYLFTDGFTDQFGGEKNRKFLTNNFKKLLVDNANKSLEEQKRIIELTFLNWKGQNSQVDDILILGFEIMESYGEIEFF